MKNNYIDLFSGCGGLALGLHNAGWKGLFAIEKSKDAFSTLKHNLIDNNSNFNSVVKGVIKRINLLIINASISYNL